MRDARPAMSIADLYRFIDTDIQTKAAHYLRAIARHDEDLHACARVLGDLQAYRVLSQRTAYKIAIRLGEIHKAVKRGKEPKASDADLARAKAEYEEIFHADE